MNTEPSWGPHIPIPVEQTWNTFIPLAGGKLISELISKSPNFENADFLFEEENVILELKEVETNFGEQSGFNNRLDTLYKKLYKEDPSWRPLLLGGTGRYPDWFHIEYLRALGKPVVRIIEKANRQIKSTKLHLKRSDAQGVLLFVNDGFTSLSPEWVYLIAVDALSRSYSSVSCFIYLTVNRYVDIPGSNIAHLPWVPAYSSEATDELVAFVNNLGRKWFGYLDSLIGPFEQSVEFPDSTYLKGSKSIKL